MENFSRILLVASLGSAAILPSEGAAYYGGRDFPDPEGPYDEFFDHRQCENPPTEVDGVIYDYWEQLKLVTKRAPDEPSWHPECLID